MTVMDYVTLLTSLAALAVALWAAINQHRTSNNSNGIMLASLLREHAKPSFSKTRYYILHQELSDSDPSRGMEGISVDHRSGVIELVGFYDLIGIMRAHKLIDRRIVDNYLGGAAISVYTQMKPYISTERTKRSGPYMHYFEHWATYAEITLPPIKPPRNPEPINLS
jgi:hypothetical protein